MSHATLWSTFRALDIPRDRMTLHGFRAMARTILDEVLGFRPDFIEHQLAHAVRDPKPRLERLLTQCRGPSVLIWSVRFVLEVAGYSPERRASPQAPESGGVRCSTASRH